MSMPDLKRLITEIHRRSLWQVLGIYVVGAWAAYQVILSLTEGGVLPAWFPGVAFGLFLVGLPVVLATAFVQEGLPGSGRVRGAAPRRLHSAPAPTAAGPTAPGDASRPPGGAPPSAPMDRVFTWRNAIAAGVFVFVVAGLVGGVAMTRSPRAAAPLEAERSVAVLPFVNMSADPENEYFSDGLSEELLNALAQIPGLQVAARTSSFALKGQGLDLREASRRLGVQYVVEGSVRKAGGEVRITAQLIRGDNGFHLWSETYDRELSDVFAVQDEIARAIAGALRLRLTDDPAAAGRTTNPRAHDLYLLGLSEWNRRNVPSLRRAVGYFTRATEEDPGYARAYAGLALASLLVPIYDTDASAAEYMEQARAAAARALRLDSLSVEAHTALADIHWRYDYDPAAAEASFRRAIAANPSYATAHQWYGELLLAMGRHEEGLAALDRALALDPLSLAINTLDGLAFLIARGADEALPRLRRALEIDPAYGTARSYTFMAHLSAGSPDSAAVEMSRWLDLTYGIGRVEADRIAAAVVDRSRAEDALRLLQSPALRDRVLPSTLGMIHAAIGDEEGALDRLEQALDERTANLGNVLAYPALDPLRGHPRFQAILRRMGLAR